MAYQINHLLHVASGTKFRVKLLLTIIQLPMAYQIKHLEDNPIVISDLSFFS